MVITRQIVPSSVSYPSTTLASALIEYLSVEYLSAPPLDWPVVADTRVELVFQE